MARSEQEHREEIVQVGRLMFEKGWIAANDGNITVRLDSGHLLATPRGVSKGMLKPEDLAVVDMDGNKISGPLEVTTEIGMHLTIYRERPDVNAVVHAHPATATGFAVAGRALNLGTLPEVIICLGSVPLAEYGCRELRRSRKVCCPTSPSTMPCCWRIMARWRTGRT